MHPKLHEEVSKTLKSHDLEFDFYATDDDNACIQTYDTHVMGKFNCKNERCNKIAWTSKKIAITIRMYNGEQYNARVYNQRCKACNTPSRASVDKQSYVERVTYRIMKWSGLEVEPPTFSGRLGPDHETELCEGCRAGHCNGI